MAVPGIASVDVAKGADTAARNAREEAVNKASRTWAAAVNKLAGKDKCPALSGAIAQVQKAWTLADQELDAVSPTVEDALKDKITDATLLESVSQAILILYALPPTLPERCRVVGAARARRRSCDEDRADYVNATCVLEGPLSKADAASLRQILSLILGFVNKEHHEAVRTLMAPFIFDALKNAPAADADVPAAAAEARPPMPVTLLQIVEWLHVALGTCPSDATETIAVFLQTCAPFVRPTPCVPSVAATPSSHAVTFSGARRDVTTCGAPTSWGDCAAARAHPIMRVHWSRRSVRARFERGATGASARATHALGTGRRFVSGFAQADRRSRRPNG